MVHWWCRLGADDIDAPDALAGQGAANQIDAWVVVVKAQTDGTLAHACERWIGATASAAGWSLEVLSGDTRSVPGFGFG